jgi:hypothetical protein
MPSIKRNGIRASPLSEAQLHDIAENKEQERRHIGTLKILLALVLVPGVYVKRIGRNIHLNTLHVHRHVS